MSSDMLPRRSACHVRIMHIVLLVALLTLTVISSVTATSRNERITSSLPPNSNLTSDCAIRAFGLEVIATLMPNDFLYSNWTTSARSAFELDLRCANVTINSTSTQAIRRRENASKPADWTDSCSLRVYVDGVNGNDQNRNGSMTLPFATINRAVRFIRSQMSSVRGSSPCLIIRSGTYYLGSSLSIRPGNPLDTTYTDSVIGAIALTAADSGLTIGAMSGETVVLSGGVALDKLNWSVYRNTSSGTILSADLSHLLITDYSFNHLNELYISYGENVGDEFVRAIRAKYPNGDPSTTGRWTTPTGFIDKALNWLVTEPESTVNIQVAAPIRNNTNFPYHFYGVGGKCKIFDPPSGIWCASNNSDSVQFNTPSALVYDPATMSPRINQWKNPSTGYIHAFPELYWGSWVYELASLDTTTQTIQFGRGGFQEGRGLSYGADYYISNILEELDYPNEWFVSIKEKRIYFMPNQSAMISMPKRFVLSQLPCILSARGDISSPVNNITIRNIIFTHTSNTYMRPHHIPAGGDWSIHGSGSIALSGTSNIHITNSLFTQLGSNAIAIIGYNVRSLIENSEFSWLGQSGIILIGFSQGIDGVSTHHQPTDIYIHNNLLHELGIYIKQSAGVFHTISRRIHCYENVFFNVPRAAALINDGFNGGSAYHHNVFFNAMRETLDHSMMASWDRMTYLTDYSSNHHPTTAADWNEVSYNFFYTNYNSKSGINQDDGSSWYNNTGNIYIYAGFETWIGHNKHNNQHIIIYPDYLPKYPCVQTQMERISQYDEKWLYNKCYIREIYPAINFVKSCRINGSENNINNWLFSDYNEFFYPEIQNIPFVMCRVNGSTNDVLSLGEWQSATGQERNSQIKILPPIEEIIDEARTLLFSTL